MASQFDQTDDLTAPVSQTLNADKLRINAIVIDREREQIVVAFSKGYEDTEFHEVFRDSHTFRNESDETGEPDPAKQYWQVFLDNTRIATVARAAAGPLANGELLRDFFVWALKQVGAA